MRPVISFLSVATVLSMVSLAAAADTAPESNEISFDIGTGLMLLSPNVMADSALDGTFKFGFTGQLDPHLRLYFDQGISVEIGDDPTTGYHGGLGVITLDDMLRVGGVYALEGLGREHPRERINFLMGDIGVAYPVGGGLRLGLDILMGPSWGDSGNGFATGLAIGVEKGFEL